MKDKTATDIQAHALARYPEESCGLVVIIKGKERFLPCRNVADNPRQEFTIHHADYAAAEDLGDIIGIAHSHNNGDANPSQADRVACEQSQLPWYITAVNTAQEVSPIVTLRPSGYIADYVGRTFVHGVMDCYTLVRDFHKREFAIDLPAFAGRRPQWWNKGDNLYMVNLGTNGFMPVARNSIQYGDLILMQIRSPQPNHGAIYMGEGRLLHHMFGRLSCHEMYGGWHQEMTVGFYRHKDIPQ
jgi:proteasome lid subunit RPN8/RPN11